MRELDGVLHAYDRPFPAAQRPQASEAVDRAGMMGADRLAHDDLSGDQLDPAVLGEDAGLAHPVVLLDGESIAREQIAHGEPPAGHSSVRAEARHRRHSDTQVRTRAVGYTHAQKPGEPGAR